MKQRFGNVDGTVFWIISVNTISFRNTEINFLNHTGDDEYNIIVNATAVLSIFITLTVSGCYLFMDIFLSPESLRKYKVQSGANEPVDLAKVWKVSWK